MALKNRYFATIYAGCLKKDPIRKIHKALYDETIASKPQYADKYLLAMALKLTNKAKKLQNKNTGALAAAVFSLFWDQKVNDKAKKLINHAVGSEAERKKGEIISDFVANNRDNGKWFYMASSHDDCAKDHLDYQGKLYIDNQAPEEAMAYARSKKLRTIQWVMGDPVWFITRPNCRHYFVGLSIDQVKGKSLKDLKKKHHTHVREGNRAFQTPKTAAIEEYTDRLRMLKALQRERNIPELDNLILKTEILLKKWKRSYN